MSAPCQNPEQIHIPKALLEAGSLENSDLQAYLEESFGFRFEGDWLPPQLKTLYRALGLFEGALAGYTNSPFLAWMQTYLGGTSFKQRLLFHRFYYVWRSKIHVGQGFSVNAVVHEFGHILDNQIAGKNAAVWGGGPADALFRAVGGDPRIGWLRFRNGAKAQPYRNDVGAMASLPEAARFPAGHYGNHSSADYFAETWAALIRKDHQAPPAALAWMAAFIARLA